MRKSIALLIIAATIALAVPAFAELQNVVVSGTVRLRGNWYSSEAGADSWTARNSLFQPPWTNSFRGIGGNPLAGLRWPAVPGRAAVTSAYSWDDNGNDNAFVEQRTRLGVRATFSENVDAFIELDSYDIWGEDFRSNYLTGADQRAVTNTDVEVYQSYIDVKQMWGTPLCLSLGRQEFNLGSGWVIGPNDAGARFTGLSWDSIKLAYGTDLFRVAALWAKTVERSPVEEDGDVDMYGVYASYLGIENNTIDAYWLLARNAIGVRNTFLQPGLAGDINEMIEDFFGVDDYDVSNLHLLGLRAAGTWNALDYEAELAYEFGCADFQGFQFSGLGIRGYGDDNADFGVWGGNLEVGYTFDTAMKPRVFLGGAYFGGEDNRDVNFVEWLAAVACPFYRPDASVCFNRIASNWRYSEFLDGNCDMSNTWLLRGGVSAQVTDQVELKAVVSHFEAVESYAAPWPTFNVLGMHYTPFAFYSFLDKENDSDLGTEVDLYATYKYSEDLTFKAGYAHLFVGDGLKEGNFCSANGFAFNGGTDDDDADYFFFDTKISF